jgi:hypothetical protein
VLRRMGSVTAHHRAGRHSGDGRDLLGWWNWRIPALARSVRSRAVKALDILVRSLLHVPREARPIL